MSEAVAARVVPGAPPPAPLSKSQKKKRRAAQVSSKADEQGDHDSEHGGYTNGNDITINVTAPADAALVDKVPAADHVGLTLKTKPEDVANAAIASGIAADILSAVTDTSILSPQNKRVSAVVELVQKRHRALHKKIQRVKEYAAKPVDTLNDDQRKSLATLPQLEASSREVEEVRKAIEIHEADEAAGEARRLSEIEAVVRQRIASAVSEAQNVAVNRAVELVNLTRELHQLPKHASSDAHTTAVITFTEVVQSADPERLHTAVGLYIAGQGDYAHLAEVLEAALHPPSRTATPVVEAQQPVEPEPVEEAPMAENPIGGIPSMPSMTGSYHFMQESELEPSTPFDEGAEWVEHPEETAAAPEAAAAPGKDGAIDWAAEDHEDTLPPIAGLQEHFGTSGQATPVAETPATDFPESGDSWQTGGYSAGTAGAGDSGASKPEDDGFTTIPNKRGGYGDRPRGRGGFRGGRGGHSSSDWRARDTREGGREGGDGSGRGGYRGTGEHRGRGEYRGEYRGRPRGEYRGRGGGEYRGRGGGGEGRGGYRGRPAAAAPPTDGQ